MLILLALILLVIVFLLMSALLDEWDKMRGRVVIMGIVGVGLVLAGVVLLRYQLARSTGCVPNCAGANLVGRNLHGLSLDGVNFVEADLSSADLGQAQLTATDFSGANLYAVNLEGANLQNARLLGANLTGANLAGANLTGADLRGAELQGADLTGVDLTQTDLKGAILTEAELVGVNLTGAVLPSIVLAGAHMNGALLANANLAGANLSRADLNGVRLTGSDLRGAWLNTTNLIGADLTNVNLAGASLIGAVLASADLGDSRLVGTNLIGVNFKGVSLRAANLLGAVIQPEALPSTELTLDPILAELNELQRGQILVAANLDGASFDGQTIWPDSAYAQTVAQATELLAVSDATAANTIKVGILHSLTGDLAVSEAPMIDATLLAIDEINAAGGVLGKELEPIVEDGASDPAVFADKTRKLLEQDEVAVIFGGWSSDSRQAMRPVLEALQGLLFYLGQVEGFEQSPNIFYIGATPAQQILPAIDYLVSLERAKILLLGTDDAYARTIHAVVNAQLTAANRTVVGEVYVALGETDFSQIIAQIQAAPPDAIFNTLQGAANVAFFRALVEAGFTSATLPILSTTLTEETIQTIGATGIVGQLTTAPYYQTLQTTENFAFVTAFKNVYGEERVTAYPGEAGYRAVYLWQGLVEAAQSTAVIGIRRAAATPIDLTAPSGPVQIDSDLQYLYHSAQIGRVRDDGLIEVIFQSEAPIAPDPNLTRYPWAVPVRTAIAEAQAAASEKP